MEVLYYCVRKTISDNNFSLKGVTAIKISNKFIDGSVVININHRFTTQMSAFSLLLSIRALMLDKSLIGKCDGDMLLFQESPVGKYEWISYCSIIMDCMKDDEFCDLYALIENVHEDSELSYEDREKFLSTTHIPEYRNLPNYYRTIAKEKTGIANEVVCNNAFVCEIDLEDYIVPQQIEYIGNTAFSYCPNLTTITLQRDDIRFGVFPIIECDKLRRILVPVGSEDYYKDTLPYYKNIIFSKESLKVYDDAKSAVLQRLSSTEEVMDKIQDYTTVASPSSIGHLAKETVSQSADIPTEGSVSLSTDVKSTISHETKTIYPEIDPKKLKHIFEKKVTSYKYFWFSSIISLLKEKGELSISFQDIVIRMASQAWPIVFGDKLELGTRDMMKKYLSELKGYTSLTASSTSNDVENWLQNRYGNNIKRTLEPLLKNVPYRFLSPWIKYVSDEDMIEKSNSNDYAALYALHKDHIIMDEDWVDYILENYDSIYKFTIDSFTEYLKQYNNGLALLGFMARNK